jgi:O-antigen ligase
LVVTASIAKGFDGVAIYLFAPAENKSWGTLMLWRDGFLVAMNITATALLLYYKGTTLKWLKRALLITLPVTLTALITSYRRTFFIAILVNLFLMFVTVGKGNRLKHLGIFFSLITAIFFVILATDPIGFLTRLFSAVVNPSEEGSAYIRLMELPNVLLNIYNNPIFGTAIGTQWHQYLRMPLFANYTTLGTHNSYLYWPLRAGIMGLVGFWWMITRMWKTIFLQIRLQNSPEDRFFAFVSFFMLITYMVGSFFGLMYGDTVTVIVALHLTSLQLFLEERFGKHTLKNLKYWDSLRAKKLIPRYQIADTFSPAG